MADDQQRCQNCFTRQIVCMCSRENESRACCTACEHADLPPLDA